MPGPSRFDELTARLRAPDPWLALAGLVEDVVPGQTGPADRTVALVWATADVGLALEVISLPFRRSARDRMLGGSTAAVRYGPVQVLLEQPEEEGRLAAYLSRHGEGVAAIYLERPRFMPPSSASSRPRRPVHTPLGRRGWLLPHDWPWGPFVIALEEER